MKCLVPQPSSGPTTSRHPYPSHGTSPGTTMAALCNDPQLLPIIISTALTHGAQRSCIRLPSQAPNVVPARKPVPYAKR